MSDKNGGPGSPSESRFYSEQRVDMTLRDYFAAKAMQGIAANQCMIDSDAKTAVRFVVEMAYDLADAMLAERAK